MKLRDLLKKLRLRSLQEGERAIDNVDALASMGGQAHSALGGDGSGAAPMAPPNWVPSQQDRPRH